MKNENTIFINAYADIYLAVSEYFQNNDYALNLIKRLAYLNRTYEQCADKWIDYINRTYRTATDKYNTFVFCAISITPKDSVLHNILKNDRYYTQPKHFIEVLEKYKDMKRQPLPQLVFKVEESQKDTTIYTIPPPYKRENGGQFDLANCTQKDLGYLYLVIGSDNIYCEAPQASTDTETLPSEKIYLDDKQTLKIRNIYNKFLLTDKITLSDNDFLVCVENADFSKYKASNKLCAALYYIDKYVLKKTFDNWLENAAKSIDKDNEYCRKKLTQNMNLQIEKSEK